MHPITFIRNHPEKFDHGLSLRGLAPMSADILVLDEQVRGRKTRLQELQEQSNRLAKEIGMRKSKGENADDIIAQSKEAKQQLAALKCEEESGEDPLNDLLMSIPNIPEDGVPMGASEEDNVELRVVGKKPEFSFTPKEHWELGEQLGLMDFETAAKLSGSRFVVLKGELARLERALGQFMLNTHTREFGYEEMSAPILVKDAAMFGSGQLPKFSEDSFETTDGYRLIPTSEVSLVNLVRDSILTAEELPKRFVTLSPCFRSEAGSAGRDTRGMFRQHQFYKVELVSVTTPEDSAAELDRKTACAEHILSALGLSYRVVLLCSGDMGFTSKRTYDLEVWLPGQDRYREISSCSNCGDFQSQRMKTRYRADDNTLIHPHTLNGSGLAVGRTLIAVLEHYQQEDGSIIIPEILRPLMGGLDVINKI